MKRGEVYDVRFDPIEGSEAAGQRPAIVVSRDSLNATSPNVIVVPCTRFREGRRVYPSQVVLRRGHGGLTADSIAQAELVRSLSRTRFVRHRGSLSAAAMAAVSTALRTVLDTG